MPRFAIRTSRPSASVGRVVTLLAGVLEGRYDKRSLTDADLVAGDVLVRKTLCFYREQKEPLKPIAYDNAEFIKFLKELQAQCQHDHLVISA